MQPQPGMQLFDELRAEHALIERVVGALQTFAAGQQPPADRDRFVRFFRIYADRFHHEREEQVLFPALVATEVPAKSGPLAVIAHDHELMRALVAELSVARGDDFRALALKYGEALLHHIDAENSVLFPEAELRFARKSLRELPTRAPDEDEAAARNDAEKLVTEYPPREIPGIFRADGCVGCHAYGVSCDGIEREWWSDLEWEDAQARLGSD